MVRRSPAWCGRAEHQAALASEGFATRSCSFDDPAEIPALDAAGSIVYYFVPPPGGGIADSRARSFCAALSLAEPPARIIYMSATSVYSETGGGVVTEDSPAEPQSAMGKRRLDAEQAFREYGAAAGVPVHHPAGKRHLRPGTSATDADQPGAAAAV